MKPARSSGHRLARRSLGVTLILVAVLAFRLGVFTLSGSAGAFTAPLGVVLVTVTVAAAVLTTILYVAMFTAWLSTRRDRHRGHAPTTRKGTS